MIYEIIHFKYIFEVHELEITPSKGQSMIYVYKTYMLHNIIIKQHIFEKGVTVSYSHRNNQLKFNFNLCVYNNTNLQLSFKSGVQNMASWLICRLSCIKSFSLICCHTTTQTKKCEMSRA